MARDPDLSHVVVRDAYLSQFPHTCYGLGEWRRYDNGIWIPKHELEIKCEIQAMAEAREVAVTSYLVDSVFKLIKARRYVADSLFNASSAIAFEDCLLSLPERDIIPHSPNQYITSKLPFAYDPNAQSPTWTKFLDETVSDCQDFLQEFAGLSLTSDIRHEVAIWLYGPPGGGKSTFIAGLQAMLGDKFCVLGLHDIQSSNFGLTQLPGKTVALSTEQPASYVQSAELINNMISGEPINIHRKYKEQITLSPIAKFIWAMNELPRVTAHGLFRRVKVVHFAGIPLEVRNPRVKEDIQRSGMAIANWALEGLARLEKRGCFIIPASVAEATEYYRITNDPIQMFLDECCVLGPEYRTGATELYKRYVRWCKEDSGHKPETSTRFGIDLDRLGIKGHKISRIYRMGVRIKDPGEDDSNEILEDYARDSREN